MQGSLFSESVGDDGVARITLTRPEVHNAFNEVLIERLTTALKGLESDARVRAVVLAAEGRSFSAGADLNWMKSMAGYSQAENLADARKLAELMETLNRLDKPTVAEVQGSAFGGGVGLVAACDIAVAAAGAQFCLSEVRLGLIPAVIAPYVVAAMGERAARRYFLTAERFSAEEAERVGLVHAVVQPDELEHTTGRILEALLAGGPSALKEAKDLIFAVSRRPTNSGVMDDTAGRIARVRVSEEGQEGIAAFLEKRKPSWTQE
ncbi:MAG: enoyl-CoA hydratase/isomerase family protein [Rhodovibrionaceae bacterium]|nr:enoyl-CoA hydratase/isomerase family protein [Rhodovibrionaceae bacterium]